MIEAQCGAAAFEFHLPVMAREVVSRLGLKAGMRVVDSTLGGGGHAAAIIEAISPGGEFIGIDRDPDAISASMARLEAPGSRIRLIRGRMGEMGTILNDSGFESVDAILADLGVSSFQLDTASRGFSFGKDAPLDMRMDPTCGGNALDLIASMDEGELAAIIREYGEERYARRIARALSKKSIRTTGELAAAVAAAVPPQARHGRIHPATRTFQALRIAVNDEMGELSRFLETAPGKLSAGGRLAVISYHSLEDRKVKHSFRGAVAHGGFSLPFRRPVIPNDEEIAVNPRARSAKLRVMERI
ncbi:MAG: 16S rRNA (cytosine(1402)-N(4))-methyltransferase RsmH [Pseudomonadota bacterium]